MDMQVIEEKKAKLRMKLMASHDKFKDKFLAINKSTYRDWTEVLGAAITILSKPGQPPKEFKLVLNAINHHMNRIGLIGYSL